MAKRALKTHREILRQQFAVLPSPSRDGSQLSGASPDPGRSWLESAVSFAATAQKKRGGPHGLSIAYAGFLLLGGRSLASPGQVVTAAFLGALLGFLLAIMFTIRQRRRETRFAH